MWLIFRIGLIVVAALYKQIAKLFAPKLDIEWNGIPYTFSVSKNKQGTVLGSTVQIDFKSGVYFNFHNEAFPEDLLKKIGLTFEFQTGDKAFDERVFIGCDHQAMGPFLKNSPEVRQLIVQMLDHGGCKMISSDGQRLKFKFNGEFGDSMRDISHSLRKAMEPFLTTAKSVRWADPFLRRLVLMEIMILCLTSYAIGGLGEIFFGPTLYLQPKPLWGWTFLVAAGLFSASVFLLVLFFRKSARSASLIKVYILLLLFSLPTASWQMLDDYNRQEDPSISKFLTAEISGKWTETRRRRKGGRYTVYFFRLLPKDVQGYNIRTRLQVDSGLYFSKSEGSILEMELKDGRLKVPYILDLR